MKEKRVGILLSMFHSLLYPIISCLLGPRWVGESHIGWEVYGNELSSYGDSGVTWKSWEDSKVTDLCEASVETAVVLNHAKIWASEDPICNSTICSFTYEEFVTL